MATTTNYSWTTPDDTALVKDGAAAIRSLGTAIDTTVFTNAGAAIAKTIVDAKGDLIVASGSDAVARLAVGTNDYVLTADSGATNGIKWAALPASGSLTLLSTTSLTGSSVTISSISQSYKNLLVIVNGVYLASDDKAITVIFNATGSGHNYTRFGYAGGGFNSGDGVNAGSAEIGRAGSNSSSNYAMTSILQIARYTETSIKTFSSNYYYRPATGSNGGGTSNGTFTAASGIDSIKFEAETVNFSAGTVYIYGVN